MRHDHSWLAPPRFISTRVCDIVVISKVCSDIFQLMDGTLNVLSVVCVQIIIVQICIKVELMCDIENFICLYQRSYRA